MDETFTLEDHNRICDVVKKIIIQTSELTDVEFCLFAANIVLNAVLKVEKPMRARMLADILSTVKRVI